MSQDANVEQITLSEAAKRLAVSYERAKRLLLTGALVGEQMGGRWYMVDLESVERMARERSVA